MPALVDAQWDSENRILELTWDQFVTKDGSQDDNVAFTAGGNTILVSGALDFVTTYVLHVSTNTDIIAIRYTQADADLITNAFENGNLAITLPNNWGTGREDGLSSSFVTFNVLGGQGQGFVTVSSGLYVYLPIANINPATDLTYAGVIFPSNEVTTVIMPFINEGGLTTTVSYGKHTLSGITAANLAIGATPSSFITIEGTGQLVI